MILVTMLFGIFCVGLATVCLGWAKQSVEKSRKVITEKAKTKIHELDEKLQAK